MIILEKVKTRTNFSIAHNIFQKSRKKISFEKFYRRWKDSSVYLVKQSKKIVGYVLVTQRNEIGYFILPEFQRKKFGSTAIVKLMKIEKRPYYWALIDFDNAKSLRFIQSLGFIPKSLVYVRNTKFI